MLLRFFFWGLLTNLRTHLEEDIVSLMQRRAYDIAASTRGRCHVFLNGRQLDVQSFEDYVGMFLESDDFRRSLAASNLRRSVDQSTRCRHLKTQEILKDLQ